MRDGQGRISKPHQQMQIHLHLQRDVFAINGSWSQLGWFLKGSITACIVLIHVTLWQVACTTVGAVLQFAGSIFQA